MLLPLVGRSGRIVEAAILDVYCKYILVYLHYSKFYSSLVAV